jgi:hypothetical protein
VELHVFLSVICLFAKQFIVGELTEADIDSFPEQSDEAHHEGHH